MMDKGDRAENVCINLEFLRSQSSSKQEKIKQFWKFLDSQSVLKPFKEQKIVEDEKAPETYDTCNSPPPSDPSVCSSKVTSTKPKQNVKRNKAKHEKSPNDDLCKLEKYFREDLRYADSVEPSYEKLNAEIEDFHRRLLRCNCKIENCDCVKK